MSSKLKPWTALSILFVMSGCVPGSTGLSTSPTPIVVSDYCRIAAPISYDSARDTPETVKAIEAHNSKWVCVCEHDCPAQ